MSEFWINQIYDLPHKTQLLKQLLLIVNAQPYLYYEVYIAYDAYMLNTVDNYTVPCCYTAPMQHF